MINEIKKEFYRTPTYTAQLIHADHSGLAYSVNVVLGDTEDQFKTILVTFKIPYDDMGSAKFYNIMPAKHLIRWMHVPGNVVGQND